MSDLARWQHTRLRRRMLYGQWEQDLRAKMVEALGTVRADAWKIADLSANVFRSSMMQLAVAYSRPPSVKHENAADADLMTEQLHEAGLWVMKRRYQRDLLGMREMAMGIMVSDGQLRYRPIYPDMCTAEADPGDPDQPVLFREAVLREVKGQQLWTWDVWDIRDPEQPSLTVEDERGNKLGGLLEVDGQRVDAITGDAYRAAWSYQDGTPFIPIVLDHAEKTGYLWDAYEGQELITGTLLVAVYWSMWGHTVRTSSWAQRYSINALIGAGSDGLDSAQRTKVVTDPSTVAQFRQDDEATGQAVLGQWAPPVDPKVLAEAIALYERRLASFAGVSPSDVQRVAGDPRSGFALAISREGKRESQLELEPQLRAGDEELIKKSAAMLNRAQGAQIVAEDGWAIRYHLLPLSADERDKLREHLYSMKDRGLIDDAQILIELNPGMTRAEALMELARLAPVEEPESEDEDDPEDEDGPPDDPDE
jgi:hypothetical protein